jgi:hypothetical protein
LDDPEYAYPGPRAYRAMLGVPIIVDDDVIGRKPSAARAHTAFPAGPSC